MAGKTKWKFAEFGDPEMSTVVERMQINRSLFVDRFSDDPDLENGLVEVSSTRDLFQKIPARAGVEVENLEGDVEDTELEFQGIADFNRDRLILMVEALREQSETADILEHFLKLFGKGGKWKNVFDDPAARAGFLQRLDAVLALLES